MIEELPAHGNHVAFLSSKLESLTTFHFPSSDNSRYLCKTDLSFQYAFLHFLKSSTVEDPDDTHVIGETSENWPILQFMSLPSTSIFVTWLTQSFSLSLLKFKMRLEMILFVFLIEAYPWRIRPHFSFIWCIPVQLFIFITRVSFFLSPRARRW